MANIFLFHRGDKLIHCLSFLPRLCNNLSLGIDLVLQCLDSRSLSSDYLSLATATILLLHPVFSVPSAGSSYFFLDSFCILLLSVSLLKLLALLTVCPNYMPCLSYQAHYTVFCTFLQTLLSYSSASSMLIKPQPPFAFST